MFTYFAVTHRRGEFFDAVFMFNLGYGQVGQGFATRFVDFFHPVFDVFGSAAPVWYVAAVALPVLLLVGRKQMTGRLRAVVAYAAGSYVAVCLPGRFWPHYYQLLVPPAVLIGVLFISTMHSTVRSKAARFASVVASLVWIAAVVFFQLNHYWLLEPGDITAPHRNYRYRQAWSRAQGERVADLTDPGDTIFVWGRDAGIYYYGQRRCASRFTMVGALAVMSPGSRAS